MLICPEVQRFKGEEHMRNAKVLISRNAMPQRKTGNE